VVGTRDKPLLARDRVVRAMVRNPKSSQDEILTPVKSSRYHNFGKARGIHRVVK